MGADDRGIAGEASGVVRGDPDNRRTRDVRVRLTEVEWRAWHAVREVSGRRELGAWVRAFINEALLGTTEGRRPGDLPRVVVPEANRDAVVQLRRMGVNLNQLAHAANAEGRLTDVDELRRLLVHVEDVLCQVRGQRPPRVVIARTEVGDPPPAGLVDEDQAVDEDQVVDEDRAVTVPRQRRWFGARS